MLGEAYGTYKHGGLGKLAPSGALCVPLSPRAALWAAPLSSNLPGILLCVTS